jgi:hypothetical protein
MVTVLLFASSIMTPRVFVKTHALAMAIWKPGCCFDDSMAPEMQNLFGFSKI